MMIRPIPLLLALLLIAACGPVDEAAFDHDRRAPGGQAGHALAAPDERIETIQLYRTGRESALPVIPMGGGQTLTLEFDRIDDGMGGPLQIYFYHTDRNWNRRLMAVEYLRGFHNDQIRDYQSSAATRVRYTHYRYDFPNDVIDFTRSGNFILRVTEQADESAVLFEQAFFVTEEIAEMDLAVQSGFAAGLGGPMMQPVARVRPPSRYDSPIHDFDVCFARDGQFDALRCSDQPRLLGASLFQFYLPEDRAFTPRGPRYELDLSVLGAGPQIASVDLRADPFRVVLNPNDARFGDAFFDQEMLSGQSIVRAAVQDAFQPDVQSEYVETTFRYVPHEREQVAGRVILMGSFNGWAIDPRNELTWDPDEREYRGTFLIKQGRHSYTYYVEDPAEQERRARTAEVGRPTLYTGFVYLHDPAYNTDRLLSVQNVLGQ